MAEASQGSFSCPHCGRQYAWKPQLAGRKAKCKCGQVVIAPTALAEPEPQSPEQIPVAGCPACGAELATGAILCIQCGYNLRTGQMLGTQTDVADEPPPPPAKPARKKSSAPQYASVQTSVGYGNPGENRSNLLKQVGAVVGVIVVVAGLIFGGRMYMQGRGARGGAAVAAGPDAAALELFQGEERIEAREYLNVHDSRMLGTQWTRGKAKGMIDRWYDEMGCKKVWAFQGQLCRRVVLELSDDPEKRQAVFGWIRGWEGDDIPEDRRTRDVGQKYYVVTIP